MMRRTNKQIEQDWNKKLIKEGRGLYAGTIHNSVIHRHDRYKRLRRSGTNKELAMWIKIDRLKRKFNKEFGRAQ